MKEKRRNAYACNDCNAVIVTVDRDEGITPMMLRCRATKGCRGTMTSCMYRDVPDIAPAFEWRKPTPPEYQRASPGMKQHFDRGGLDIYPIASAEGSAGPVAVRGKVGSDEPQ